MFNKNNKIKRQAILPSIVTKLLYGMLVSSTFAANALDIAPIVADLNPIASVAGNASNIVLTVRDQYLPRLETELAFIESKLTELEKLPDPINSFVALDIAMKIAEHALPLIKEVLQPDGLVQKSLNLLNEAAAILKKGDEGMANGITAKVAELRAALLNITSLLTTLQDQLQKFSKIIATLAKLHIKI
ncbi:TPA: hypothetical protein DDZ86_04505 [Candidatus Dependentiae bacterium]|nr:MAG: hypothetical protein UW09_C0002G0132 [candidate division TM6 bacterium GW2011_GWF2_43_87]HBL98874.1 hypothetical protein [Candidatus Dependentiae bacterium]